MTFRQSDSAGKVRRTILALLALGLLVGGAGYSWWQRSHVTAAAAAEDCEEKPPANEFAVAECDDGAVAPAGGAGAARPAAPPSPAPSPAQP